MVFSEGQHRLHQPQQRHDLRSSRGETDGIIDSVTDWEAEDSDGGHHGARLSRRSWGNHHLVMMISPEDVFFFWDVVINQIGYHGIASIRWDWVSEISNRCILQYSGISRVKVEHVELYKETTFPVCHSGFSNIVLFWSWYVFCFEFWSQCWNIVCPICRALHFIFHPSIVEATCCTTLPPQTTAIPKYTTAPPYEYVLGSIFLMQIFPPKQISPIKIWGVGHLHCNLHQNKPYGNIKLNHHGRVVEKKVAAVLFLTVF